MNITTDSNGYLANRMHSFRQITTLAYHRIPYLFLNSSPGALSVRVLTAVQRQTAVTAFFSSRQLLLFDFAPYLRVFIYQTAEQSRQTAALWKSVQRPGKVGTFNKHTITYNSLGMRSPSRVVRRIYDIKNNWESNRPAVSCKGEKAVTAHLTSKQLLP